MASTQELKDRVFAEIDARGDEIVGVAREILAHPEAGYREVRTSKLVAKRLRGLDISCREGLALTGVKGSLAGGSSGPAIAVLGELDSLLVNDHPHADSDTGAAHACGHHAQIGMMLGVATALKHSGVMPELGGQVTFMAVPAEEFIEIEWRDEMRQQARSSSLEASPSWCGWASSTMLTSPCWYTAPPTRRTRCWAWVAPTMAWWPSGYSFWVAGPMQGARLTWASTP